MADEPKEKKIKKNNELSSAGATLGRAGGKVGGKARAEALTAAERSAIAKQGGLAKAAKAKANKQKLKGKKRKDSK